MEKRLSEVCEATAATFGATADVDFRRGYPATVNTEANTEYAIDVAKSINPASDGDLLAGMGAEDFSFMLEARPGAFIYLGNGDSAGWHHPKFDFNDETIPAGCSWFASMVETRMPAA